MTESELSAALANPNVYAFLRVIRQGESNQNDDAYTLVNGGAHFTDTSKHPYTGMRSPPGRAAGAYQFLASTWGDVAKRIGATDFGPGWQDLGAVDLLRYRDALDDIVAGRFDEACAKCRREWTSLPGAAEANQTLAKARAVYEKWGGKFAPAPTPTPQPIPPRAAADQPAPTAQSGDSMDPFTIIGILGPALQLLIPQVGKLFGGAKDAKNAQIIGTVLDTVVQAAGTAAAGEKATLASTAAAVEKMQSDGAITTAVKQAVVTHPDVMAALQIVEVGGGAAAAREADTKQQQQEKPFWKTSAVFWVSVLLMPMVYWLVGSLIVGGVVIRMLTTAHELGIELPSWVLLILSLFGDAWQGETRSGGFNLVVGLVLGGICGVYFGVSVTQAKQAAQAAAADKA